MKSFILIALVALIAIACNKKTFLPTDASSKRYGGGTILSGTGVIYTFELEALNSSKKLSVDSVYINGRVFCDFSIYKKGAPPASDRSFNKGDIVVLTVNHSKRPLLNGEHPPKIVDGEFKESGHASAIDSKGHAAIVFINLMGKNDIIYIDKFTILNPEMRP